MNIRKQSQYQGSNIREKEEENNKKVEDKPHPNTPIPFLVVR